MIKKFVNVEGKQYKSCYQIVCDDCKTEFIRTQKNHKLSLKKLQKWDITGEYCQRCVMKHITNTDEYKKTMSKAIQNAYDTKPEIRQKQSKTSRERGVNVGNKNPMKKLKNRKKLSESKKKQYANDKDLVKRLSDSVHKAWLDGKFDNVKVGRCKWFDYVDRFGNKHKAQGTWELAFMKWLDNRELTWVSHKGRIVYTQGKKEKVYLPDMFVKEWNTYIDVKTKRWYDKDQEKFKSLNNMKDIKVVLGLNENNKQKEKTVIQILFKEDLEKLGVNLCTQ